MPIYEFYCSDCHTLFNFFSSTVDTSRRPDCPRCGAPGLERKPARFATPRSAGAGRANDSLDEARLEQAMATMADEFEDGAESDDPRQMGRLMRRFGDAAGLEMGPLESMIERLEAGSDPEEAEEALKGLDEDGGDFDLFRPKPQGRRPARGRPSVDQELHFL